MDPTVYDVEIEYEGQTVEVVSKHYTMNNERQKLDLEITKTFEDEDPDAYKTLSLESIQKTTFRLAIR